MNLRLISRRTTDLNTSLGEALVNRITHPVLCIPRGRHVHHTNHRAKIISKPAFYSRISLKSSAHYNVQVEKFTDTITKRMVTGYTPITLQFYPAASPTRVMQCRLSNFHESSLRPRRFVRRSRDLRLIDDRGHVQCVNCGTWRDERRRNPCEARRRAINRPVKHRYHHRQKCLCVPLIPHPLLIRKPPHRYVQFRVPREIQRVLRQRITNCSRVNKTRTSL